MKKFILMAIVMAFSFNITMLYACEAVSVADTNRISAEAQGDIEASTKSKTTNEDG